MSKVTLALLFALGVSGFTQAATFSGTVFEDVNYGGGAGRPNGTAGTVRIGGVRVELYNASSGAFVAATTTATTPAAAVGTYTLSPGTTGAAMIIRVVNGTVRSSRTGGASTATVAVQTYRTAGAGTNNNNVNPVTNRVGGENPALSDGPTNGGNFSLIDDTGGVAQSVTTSDPSGTGSAVTGIDFGFNFSTVVNTRDLPNCGATNPS